MKMKEVVFDLWLALGVIGMVIGLAIPLVGTLYVIWGWLS
jgi:hypothetical protein